MQLVENWPAILKKAWSLKFTAAAAVLGGAEVVVGQIQPAGIPNGIFAGIAMLVSIGAFATRLLAQQEIHDDPTKQPRPGRHHRQRGGGRRAGADAGVRRHQDHDLPRPGRRADLLHRRHRGCTVGPHLHARAVQGAAGPRPGAPRRGHDGLHPCPDGRRPEDRLHRRDLQHRGDGVLRLEHGAPHERGRRRRRLRGVDGVEQDRQHRESRADTPARRGARHLPAGPEVSALGELASAAGGAVTGGLWKVGAIVLAGLLVITSGGMGFEWWLAAHDRDVARGDLKAEQGVSAELRASITVQNSAVEAMQVATAQADERGRTAQKLAAANGRRFDGALAKLADARATTCDEAMPAVNQLLKDIK